MNILTLLFRAIIRIERKVSGIEQLNKKLDVVIAQNKLSHLNQEKIMAGQADIDAATAALTQMEADEAAKIAELISDFGAIQAEIQNLQNQGVNTDALSAAVVKAQGTAAGLDPAVANITSLAPPAQSPAGTPTT